jgi:hypothetical protein
MLTALLIAIGLATEYSPGATRTVPRWVDAAAVDASVFTAAAIVFFGAVARYPALESSPSGETY